MLSHLHLSFCTVSEQKRLICSFSTLFSRNLNKTAPFVHGLDYLSVFAEGCDGKVEGWEGVGLSRVAEMI